MILIEELKKEHRLLLELADKFEAETMKDEPSVKTVSDIRWEITRKLSDHLAKEDRVFYPKLTTCPNNSIAKLANSFAAEMGGLSAAYQNYVHTWTFDKIQKDWLGFQQATTRILTALRLRIRREETELFNANMSEVACFNSLPTKSCKFRANLESSVC
jgi:hypothetical protein